MKKRIFVVAVCASVLCGCGSSTASGSADSAVSDAVEAAASENTETAASENTETVASESTEISNCCIGCAGSELNSPGTETEESSKRDGGRTVLRHIIY